jgi:hypothetical protein
MDTVVIGNVGTWRLNMLNIMVRWTLDSVPWEVKTGKS